ncbi:MAG TPA: DMT family transporter [Thermoanaerobaculia bacterium]|nr:DMT family transporter [Thermoanaerobaculia bacterium]
MRSPALFTPLAMLAFAGNSLLCRTALRTTGIDPAAFTAARIASGALVLWLLVRLRASERSPPASAGNWPSALALFGYAAAFSFAYVGLPAGTGALLLFGAVQATMILWGLSAGERFDAIQITGLIAALGGLVALVLPGLAAPPLGRALLMLGAGVAWGVYSLRGRGTADPLAATAGNFARAVPFAALLVLTSFASLRPDRLGFLYAALSGALASGVGYALWYTALRDLTATRAAVVQLSVPVLAAAGGIAFLGEPLTLRLVSASTLVLGGIALVIVERGRARTGRT